MEAKVLYLLISQDLKKVRLVFTGGQKEGEKSQSSDSESGRSKRIW
jgi:hypothetical protein